MSENEKDKITVLEERNSFDSVVDFLAEMVRKYSKLITPATIEDVISYLEQNNKKTQ